MEELDTREGRPAYTPHASLAVIAVKLREMQVFEPVHREVKIAQKTVRYSPTEKLYQAFAGLLAGVCGIVEINERLRADPALQQAFGLNGCAEQSVIQETLSACEEANVLEVHQAMEVIYQAHSRGFRHDYSKAFQILDIDLTGQPCGRKAEFATKGYFAKQRNRRGRQMGRVLATRYQEVVVDRLYPGNVQLNAALPELLQAAEQALSLDAFRRKRTVLRIDAGGGTLEDLNRALVMGYQIHAKDYSSARAERLAQSVTEWIEDPKDATRQMGYVTIPGTEYFRPVTRIAVRCQNSKGEGKVGVIVSTLSKEEALEEAPLSPVLRDRPQAALLAYVYFYDQRGGACETEFKGDKQGLGMTKRNKKRFAAQQVLTALGALAHNVLIWAKAWLLPNAPVLSGYGIKRLVRDLLSIPGQIEVASDQQIQRIRLNPYSRLARHCLSAFQSLLASLSIAVTLGET
jgi:hypothetical protein